MKGKLKLTPRKTPQQERSAQMREAILEAATRVLQKQGAAGFTTNKVAEKAGVSIGSLYQYYPNKEALLFHLHEREVQTTWRNMEAILDDTDLTPRQRIFRAVDYFFQTEAEEAELRTSLKFAAVFFHESKEFRALETEIIQRVKLFLQSALSAPHQALDFQTDFFLTLISSVAETITTRKTSPEQVKKWAFTISEMICDYLKIA